MSELVGEIVVERYRVDAFLGKGGMADVYQVWDQVRSTHLAMKVLDSKLARDGVFITNFRQEAETLRTIQHPNIVRFYGMQESKKLVFMLMEFVEGQTLRQEILRFARPFDSHEVIRIMRPVCAALNYAHRLGFVHCDIKPSNIMLHINGTVLLADFGISRVAGRASENLHGVGTPAYMAPEQIEREIPKPATDIYSVGVLLFEMLTGGKRPFTGQHARTSGNTTEKLRWEQRYLSPPSPRQFNPAISADLEAVVMRCLEKKPGQRYESILHFQNALEDALAKGVPPSHVTLAQGGNESLMEYQNTHLPMLEQISKAKAFWLGLSILIPFLIVFAFILGSGQAPRNTAIQVEANPISTPTIWQTRIPTWDTYANTRLGFSIDYPPSWVYQQQETNPVVVIASSQKALDSQGYVSNGAAMALAYTYLEKVELPPSVDVTSPSSVLDHFMNENFNHPNLLGAAQSMSIDSFPATSATYTTYNSAQDLTVILYGVAVVTPEALTLMLGVCSEAEWSIYRPFFDRMRDSLKLN